MLEIKCQMCGNKIDYTRHKKENGDIVLDGVGTIIRNNRKVVVCEDCFYKYYKNKKRNERNK